MTAARFPLFDAAAAREARDEGIDRVSNGLTRQEWLSNVRTYAYSRILSHGFVTADDVRAAFTLPDGAHHNLWGAVFRDKRFKALSVTTSSQAQRHASKITRWGRS